MEHSESPFRSVLMIVPEDGLLFEAAGIADIFHRANLAIVPGDIHIPYRVTVAATMRHRVVQGRSGLSLLADISLSDLNPALGWDTVIVTGGGSVAEKDAVAEWLKLAAPKCRRVVSVCTGAFILAQAGLLDGRKATTHWQSAAELARLYPRIHVETESIFVVDGSFWTSGGASSGFDLSLALVRDDLGQAVARQVAQYLVLFLRRPGGQSQFSGFLQSQVADPGPIRDVQLWALENLAHDLGVEQLAEHASMSPQNFARVFARETGTTPARFVEEIRIEAARQRLEQGRETIDQVAASCGWGTALGLRRAFERHLGVTPSEYRSRFGMN